MLRIHTEVYGNVYWELTHPKVVHDGDGALELLSDLYIDVLVEAGAHGAEGRKRRPVILTGLRTHELLIWKSLSLMLYTVFIIICVVSFKRFGHWHPNSLSFLTGSRSQAVWFQLPLPPLQFSGFLLELLLFLQELRRGRVHRSLTKKDAVNDASEDRWRVVCVCCVEEDDLKINWQVCLKTRIPESYTSRSYAARWASSCWAESAKVPVDQKERWTRMAVEAGTW